MKNILILIAFVTVAFVANAQKYQTREAFFQFNPNKNKTADYEGKSNAGTAVFDASTNKVAVLIPVKTFHFGNALFEEHVNENYLESNKYPNITFKGDVAGFLPTMLKKNGSYQLSVSGEADIHGIKKLFHSEKLWLEVKDNIANFTMDFTINYADFKIEIPATGQDKIVNQVPIKAVIKFNL